MTFRRLVRFAASATLLVAVTVVVPAPAATAIGAEDVLSVTAAAPHASWRWPITPPEVRAPFVAPAHEYGAGHRGIDLAAGLDTQVQSPAAGVIAFAGDVAGRGVITVDHGDGLVSTFEPVIPALAIGTPVDAGTVLGVVATGGHTPTGAVHFGVREDGEYINPMLLLDRVERAVLLPCC